MKTIERMGYVELFIGGGLLTGFALTGYGQWILTLFVLLGLLCGVGFQIVKDAIASSIKLEQTISYTLKLASWYYLVWIAAFIFAFAIGCLVGLGA